MTTVTFPYCEGGKVDAIRGCSAVPGTIEDSGHQNVRIPILPWASDNSQDGPRSIQKQLIPFPASSGPVNYSLHRKASFSWPTVTTQVVSISP